MENPHYIIQKHLQQHSSLCYFHVEAGFQYSGFKSLKHWNNEIKSHACLVEGHNSELICKDADILAERFCNSLAY